MHSMRLLSVPWWEMPRVAEFGDTSGLAGGPGGRFLEWKNLAALRDWQAVLVGDPLSGIILSLLGSGRRP